jgi:teichuronic acid biosynthesis glycosyltransferase TuaG
MKLISIIIPYYKKKKYFKHTIKSILAQTFRNFEIIIVYDEENLNNQDFIRKISKMDKRIEIFFNKKNYGAGISRNIGIKNAKGKYIAFIDADDVWNKNKLKIQYNYMKKNNILVSHTSYQIMDEKNEVISRRDAKKLEYKRLLKSCDIGLSTVMVEKKIFNNQIKFPNIKTKEDYVLWLRIARKGIIFKAIKKDLTKWRKTNSSLSSSCNSKIIRWI